jgi:DNA-binding NtrC family response regulator
MITDGEFREDLYCRLAVLTVETCPLRERRKDIPAIVERVLQEASEANGNGIYQCEEYRIDEAALPLLCEFEYPGNIRSLRNLIYELTSYVDDNEPISFGLVEASLARLRSREGCPSSMSISEPSLEVNRSTNFPRSAINNCDTALTNQSSFLNSIAKEGDIILPLELCVLRRGETFKQWTARAKRCSIEATRQATGGTMEMVAQRLGLTSGSLKSHLKRAKRVQSRGLFGNESEPS